MIRVKRNILVVDASHEVRFKLHGALKFEGYTVTEATTGDEALKVIESDEFPALVLLDLDPEGLAVLRRITELMPERQPTVIVMSEKGQREAAVRAVQLGAADFLEKPFTDRDLILSVAAALSGPQPRRAPVPHTSSELLKVIRRDLKQQHYAHAHRVFEEAAQTVGGEPAYFNLMGVLAEVENKPKAARTFYRKAVCWSGPSATAARHNLHRLDELEERGETRSEPELGDEAHLLETAMGQKSGGGFFAKLLGR